MEWTQIIIAFGGTITAIGGFEFIKWVYTRKNSKRVSDAEADLSEFGVLQKTMIFLQQQVADLTTEVRTLTKENIDLTRENSMLKTERSLKLCERRGCADRQPQSLY